MPKQGETPKLYIYIITHLGIFVKGATINFNLRNIEKYSIWGHSDACGGQLVIRNKDLYTRFCAVF